MEGGHTPLLTSVLFLVWFLKAQECLDLLATTPFKEYELVTKFYIEV